MKTESVCKRRVHEAWPATYNLFDHSIMLPLDLHLNRPLKHEEDWMQVTTRDHQIISLKMGLEQLQVLSTRTRFTSP